MPNGSHLTILQNLRRARQLTRRDLADQLGLGVSMVSKLTGDLIGWQMIRESGRSEKSSGRPSHLLSLEPTAGYAIGLDIGGNHQQGVLLNLTGEVVARLDDQHDLSASREDILLNIDRLVERLIQQAGVDLRWVFGLGVGLWGSVDPKAGVVYSWTETPALYATWKDFALRAALQERYPFPHVLIDDIVRTMGLAEVLYDGPPVHDPDFIFALADTGIGVAVMINEQPYVGPVELAGEIGHIPVAGGNIQCSCGNTGCLETVASARAVLDQVRQRLAESSILSVLRGREGSLSVQEVIQAAQEGDKLAFQILTEAGEKFGVGLAIVANLLGPRRIIVGGSLSASFVYLDAARRMVRMQALGKVTSEITIEASKLDHLAGARGAAMQVLNQLFMPGEQNLLATAVDPRKP